MENNTSLKISIPKPCHEDWNKMTANEKGAFCGKCCKTVIDFSGKTPEEIRDTLLAESGKKVCGRFKSAQLGEKPAAVNISIPFYLLPKNISYRKAFAIALFFVFGTTLFSCRTTENHVVGDIAVVPDTAVTTALLQDTTQTTITKPECTVKGDVKVEQRLGEVMVVKDTLKTMLPDSLPDEPKMGKVKIN
jgi:hypothetical protein